MENPVSNEVEAVPFLLFRVRGHLCGLPLLHVVETMRPLPIEAISGVPVAVKGLAVIRGTPLPVLDLGMLLDETMEAVTRFITVRVGARQVALAVESVVGLRSLSAAALRDIPPLLSAASENAVAAIGTLDTELLLVLTATHLVPENVWTSIKTSGETA